MTITWHCDEDGANTIGVSPNYMTSRIRFSIDEHGGEINVIELSLDDAEELSQMIGMLIEKIEEVEKGRR